MSHVVIDHHHDEEGGVYRVVVGIPVCDERAVLDETGAPVVHCSACAQPVVTDHSGDEPVSDGHAPGCDRDGEPGDTIATESVVVGHEAVHDFVFADDDRRWHTKGGKRRAHGQVASEQRGEIHGALLRRDREHADADAARLKAATRAVTLPGVGDLLAGS